MNEKSGATRSFVYLAAAQRQKGTGESGMANARKGNTADIVWQLAAPIAAQLGLQLWDVRFVKEGAGWILRIFIDRDGGVTIEDCEAMSRALDDPLDQADPIDQSYSLEVSSPGIERELTRPAHFAQLTGQSVLLRLIRPDASGRRTHMGTLAGLRDGAVCITESDGTEYAAARKDLASVTLVDPDFLPDENV